MAEKESPWAQPAEEVLRARVQAAIVEADTGSSTGRPSVKRARAHRVHQVVERSLLERRSAAWQLLPGRRARIQAANLEDGALSALDPWAFEIKLPTEWRASRSDHAIGERASMRRCGPCEASGTAPCAFCAKAGPSASCAHCAGAGTAPCLACGGAGRVEATPVVTVEIAIATVARVVESSTLPPGLHQAITNVELSGTAVFTERGLAMAARKGVGTGPYRGTSVRVSEDVDAVIDAMLTEEASGGVSRVLDRTLEVREVELYEADLDNGRTAYVCGAPAVILPEGALERSVGLLGKLRRLFGGA